MLHTRRHAATNSALKPTGSPVISNEATPPQFILHGCSGSPRAGFEFLWMIFAGCKGLRGLDFGELMTMGVWGQRGGVARK